MKKMFKAVATLAVGCALLSTSAFAALDGSVVESETAGVFTASVTKSGATAWESTILVLKAGSVDATGETPVIKSNVADGDIYYINQTSAKSATATYSIAQSTEDLYVFAGGSDENAAKFLGTIAAPAAGPVVESISITGNRPALLVYGTAQLSATVAPETVTDAVVWSSSSDAIATVSETGLVTAKGAGTVTITATLGGVSESVSFNVYDRMYGDIDGDGWITSLDAKEISLNEMWEPSLLDDGGEELFEAADIDGDGWITSLDAKEISLKEMWEPSLLDKYPY